MGLRLRKLYKKVWQKLFGVGNWQGASATWSPIQSTTRALPSDAFDELDILDAFDRMIADLKAEPDWLTAFKQKTLEFEWQHRYNHLTVETCYTVKHAKALQAKLAMA